MPSKVSPSALIDIRFNIVLIGGFLRGIDDARSLGDDLKTLYATVRALKIISEASRRLPDSLKARHPEIPWQDVKGAGNVYRHAYEDVVPSVIWDTATERLSPLLAAVDAELVRLDREGK